MKDGFICVAAGTPKIRVADCRHNAEQIFTMMREADKQGVKILALPELCVTGYTCGDLFLQDTLLEGAAEGLRTILEATRHLEVLTALGMPVRAGKKNVTEDQCARLEAAYPYMHVNSRGMGIFSRFPVEVDLIRHEDQWLYDVNRYVVDLPGEKITIFNLHLQSLGLTAGDKELYHQLTSGNAEDVGVIRTSLISKLTSALRKRAIQAQVVRSAVDSTAGSVMVCGDFNDIPGCYAQRLILGDDLHDAYCEAGFGPAITYHADRFFFRIDHILYRGNMKPLRSWVGSNPSSDHFPLIAWFELTGNAGQGKEDNDKLATHK